MPVSDFECQIARGQIGRYVGGGALSAQAMQGLEAHIADCPACKALVAERRAALMGMVDETPTHAVVTISANPEAHPLVAALRARSEEEKPKPKAAPRYASGKGNVDKPRTTPSKPPLTKPLVLAGLLAVVLVAMSYLPRAVGGHGALGAKASATFAADTLPSALSVPQPTEKVAPETPKTLKTEPKPVEKVETPVSQPLPKASAAPPTTSHQPKKAAVKPEAKPHADEEGAPEASVVRKPVVHTALRRKLVVRKRPAAHRPKRAKARASVRVYGPDGRPL